MTSQVIPQFERAWQTHTFFRIGLAKIAAFALIVCGWSIPARAQTVAGNVTSLAGSANLQRGGASMNVTVGMPVQVADEFAVAAGGKLTITLSDGSILDAGPSSRIVIDQHLLGAGASTRISLLAGLLRSLVKHSSSGSAPNFQVHTPNAILAARSTIFDTGYTQGRRRFGYEECDQFTDVQTHAGTVGVRSAATRNGPETSVDAGYETTVACNSPPASPGPLGLTGIPWSDAYALTVTTPPPASAAPPPVALPPPSVSEQP